ncbi:MAG: GNAT family N-acetyltransferase [Clostridiales bacterium]|nr:GNAT family N-acetyltransferase [Clostridiales bacterium]
MIREFKEQDIEIVMKIWLETNILAHSFIESNYWIGNFDTVKKMLPNALVYVYESNKTIWGFIGLVDNYIAGVFVLQQFQSNGIGKKLLDFIKIKSNELSLDVYKKNKRAVDFYLREEFVINKDQIDKDTGEIELSMSWRK